MRPSRCLLALASIVLTFGTARAADPVTVELRERGTVSTSVVTVGDVALISGGDAPTRARVAHIDIAELKVRELSAVVGRRTVEYRFLLAGMDSAAVRVIGAERATVTLARRTVTVEEVIAAARTEILQQFPNSAEPVVIELAAPVVVKLPEVPSDDRVMIVAKSRGKAGTLGRVQMDMTVSVGGEALLSFPLHLDVRSFASPGGTVAQTGGIVPQSPIVPAGKTQFASAEIVIRPRERVQMHVNCGGLKVTAVGEAMQAGKLGQIILVQNVDSKKTLSARVTGPGTVEVDLGGAP